MILSEAIGYAAATLTTISFIPQVLKIIIDKDTESISLFMYILFFVGVSLWLVYGVLNDDTPLIIANSITGVLALAILVYKIKYDYINKKRD